MVYEIINPSDAYTLKSDEPVLAAVACMLLGQGAYALADEQGVQVCPVFIFGGDPDAWLRKTHKVSIDELMAERALEVAAVLESVMIGGFGARAEAEAAIARMSPVDAAAFKAQRHDLRRSSMNDIGGRAFSLARAFRDRAMRVPAKSEAS